MEGKTHSKRLSREGGSHGGELELSVHDDWVPGLHLMTHADGLVRPWTGQSWPEEGRL